jgi:hypothetical protein
MKWLTRSIIAISCVGSSLTLAAQNPVLLRTLNNPTPASGDNFGAWLAPLGNDRVLVGAPYNDTTAPNAGAVYLFRTNGVLLTTFTNPSPAYDSTTFDGDRFGLAISPVGSTQVLVGAPIENAAYLFATNGLLVRTISNPEGAYASFGSAVAALGNDRVLVGAPDYTSDPDFGAWIGVAYLFGTNGLLLATFENPDPQNYDEFGFSVVPFGSDRVLIGSRSYRSGAAYLFNTNGTLLTIFTNPLPSVLDYFGHSVAAAGTDGVVIGAPWHDVGGTNAGTVFVFSTNGVLLTTITNPTPAAEESFGNRIAVLDGARLVIGSPGDDTGATDAGSAYVFSVNGTLLAHLTNPAPGVGDRFGSRLAAFGPDGALVGAMNDNIGGADSGMAYLFGIPAVSAPPALAIWRVNSAAVAISWPSSSTGYVLQQNTNAVNNVNWSNVTSSIQDDGTNKTLLVNPASGTRVYRLRKP